MRKYLIGKLTDQKKNLNIYQCLNTICAVRRRNCFIFYFKQTTFTVGFRKTLPCCESAKKILKSVTRPPTPKSRETVPLPIITLFQKSSESPHRRPSLSQLERFQPAVA